MNDIKIYSINEEFDIEVIESLRLKNLNIQEAKDTFHDLIELNDLDMNFIKKQQKLYPDEFTNTKNQNDILQVLTEMCDLEEKFVELVVK